MEHEDSLEMQAEKEDAESNKSFDHEVLVKSDL